MRGRVDFEPEAGDFMPRRKRQFLSFHKQLHSGYVFAWTYRIVFWAWLLMLLAMVSKICDAVNRIPE